MSHDDKSTRERWTQLESPTENALIQCARIRTSVLSYMRTFAIKFKLGHVLKENNLTKRITLLLSGEKKKDAYKQL